jgi:hypothetical protein
MSDVEQELKQDASEIAQQMKALGRRIEGGNESDLLIWILPGVLACSHRPLRHHPLFGGSGRNLAHEATPFLHEWVLRIREAGIKSILCLMHDKELAYYSALELGARDLIEFYRKHGFETRRVPWEDPAHSRTNRALIDKTRFQVQLKALHEFRSMPKPVLLHCSAGRDRSAPIAAYIRLRSMS